CGLSADGQPFSVAEAIGALPADIVALQETWWLRDGTDGPSGTDGAGDADAVAAVARDRGAELIRTPFLDGTLAGLGIAPRPERGSWGIAVLSRLPVTGYETVDLGLAPGDVASRTALVCSVTAPGGWPLRLVNTHLTHKLTSPVQLRRLARHLAAGPPVPTVIAGDLNMPRLATRVAGGYAPTVRGATYPAHRPLIQLDHLLAGTGVDCCSAAVLPPVGSDHLPVLGRFRRRGGR
ncbi:MAG: endonuclease/exonuclease/phosphatase family protein, partial [Streptosporangiaceae bacterium]